MSNTQETTLRNSLGTYVQDEDDPDYKYFEPSYYLILLSTQDTRTTSPPHVYFVPCSTKLPEWLTNTTNGTVFYCYYSDEVGMWLEKNSVYQQSADRYVVGHDFKAKLPKSGKMPSFELV